MITHILSNSGLTVVFSDGPKMIHKNSQGYSSALAALAQQDLEALRLIMDPRESLRRFSNNEIAFQGNGNIAVDGNPIGNYAVELLNTFHVKKMPWAPLSAFIKNMASNPSSRARNGLDYLLLNEKLPITTDGQILALKLFTLEWVDSDTGTYLVKPGDTVKIPREQVRLGARSGAEKGFSSGSKDYIQHNSSFIGKKAIVKINPADVMGTYTTPVGEMISCSYTLVKEGDIDTSSLLVDGTSAEVLYRRSQ